MYGVRKLSSSSVKFPLLNVPTLRYYFLYSGEVASFKLDEQRRPLSSLWQSPNVDVGRTLNEPLEASKNTEELVYSKKAQGEQNGTIYRSSRSLLVGHSFFS
ncbi:hypothetical protein T439DRAFT_326261 [Meredithblackwellia eburnea MCA 4105]